MHMALLAAAYVALAKLGLAMDAVSGFASLVWPPTGLAIAALVLGGRSLWPAIAVGAFTANLWAGAPLASALGIAVGNTLEAVTAASLLARVNFVPSFARLRDVVAYALFAATLSTLVSAALGVLSLYVGGVVPPAYLGDTFRAWWLGDALGALVIAPALFAWRAAAEPQAKRTWLELGGLSTALLGLTALVFGTSAAQASPFSQPYILIAVTLWAALRFGQRGATTSTLLMSAVATACTAFGLGPFVGAELAMRLALLQVFVASMAITGLFLSAAESEREARVRELERVNAELSGALSARDSFLSVASHELKTPLTTLRLQADMLMRLEDELPTKARTKVVRVSRQVERLNELVTELLEVSRLTAGRLELHTERVELVALIREVAGRFEEQAHAAGSELRVHVQGRIFGDWDLSRLDHVLSNLISNAVKYGAGTPVTVSAERPGPERLRARARLGHRHRARRPGTRVRALRASRRLLTQGGRLRARAVDSASRSSTRWAGDSACRAPPARARPSRSSFRT